MSQSDSWLSFFPSISIPAAGWQLQPGGGWDRAAGHKCWSQQRLRKMDGFYRFIVIPKEIERITVYPCRNSDNSLFYLLWHYPHMFIIISIREDRMLCGFSIFMQTKTHASHSRPDISFVGNSQTGLMEFPHRIYKASRYPSSTTLGISKIAQVTPISWLLT